MVRRSYTDQTLKIVFARSGNRCAFPGCDQQLVERSDDGRGDAVIGEIAHIVGLRRDSPRWEVDLSDAERNLPDNLILLCPTHHTMVDDPSNTRHYSVPVLRKMKQAHEQDHAPESEARSITPKLMEETVTSSMLMVEALPSSLFSARCTEATVRGVVNSIRSSNGSTHVPFYLHDGTLWSFWDLADGAGPLGASVDPSTSNRFPVDQVWEEPDLYRRYVALLNKAMTLNLESRGLRKDPDRQRHYFAAQTPGEVVRVVYESRTGRTQPLDVVREERFRDGRTKGVWWHQAVRLRFERIGNKSWCMTLRPEFFLTVDGVEPLPSRRVGRRVTRRKSTMYNREYLDRVHFWRWFLTGGTPRVIVNAGQPIIISSQAVEVPVTWPGVPDDDGTSTGPGFEETLLSLAELADAVGNVDDWEALIS